MRTYTITQTAGMWHVHMYEQPADLASLLLESPTHYHARDFAFTQAAKHAPAQVVAVTRTQGRVTIAVFEEEIELNHALISKSQ